ncbi:MAG TPA: DMT family transporter [Myxococcaceae bacterium]
MHWWVMLIAVMGGVAVGIQAAVNGTLGKNIGVLEATLVSFIVGTGALTLATVLFGRGNVSAALAVPRWQLVGGLLGSFYVFSIVLGAPRLGVTSTIVAVITGQMLAGALIDHFGVIPGRHVPIDRYRVLGLVLMAGALFLFYRKR